MTSPETSPDFSEASLSSIVRIAYHQSSVICGGDPITLTSRVEPAKSVDRDRCDMICTRRLFGLPIFTAVTSSVCGAYAAVKGSHETVTTLLGHAENGMRAGLEFASPVTSPVVGVLETPLKAIDNAVCIGLDFVEERIPSVKLPPGQIYANMRDSVRDIFTSALETLRLLFGGSKNQIDGSANEMVQGEMRKISSRTERA